MTNTIALANDAVWALLEATFTDAAAFVRNPDEMAKAPKAKGDADIAYYVVQHDDKSPEVLRTLLGGGAPIYDLAIKPHVTFVYLGDETARRNAAWAAIDQLNTALRADVTLGGAVEYARTEPPEDAPADILTWLAGGLMVPVCLLCTADSQAG